MFLLIVKIAFDLTFVNQVTQIGLFSLQIGANIGQIQYPSTIILVAWHPSCPCSRLKRTLVPTSKAGR